MKRNSLTLLVALIALTGAQAEEPSLQLVLESRVSSLRYGTSSSLTLKLSGAPVEDMIKPQEGIEPSVGPKAFVYRFNFKPQREGSFTFGPYFMEVNGKKLESNQVTINVLPEWNGTLGTFFRVNTNSIALGESVELTMETWQKDHDYISINPVHDESFSVSMGNIMSTSSGSGEDRISYRSRTWLITPRTAGEFKINKELFREFPENIKAPSFSIQVAESK